MATATVNTKTFLDSAYNSGLGDQRLYRHTLTLEQDTSTGALTLALNGVAVTAVVPAANPALVTVTAGSQAVNIPADQFLWLCQSPSGAASGQAQPPARPLGDAFDGWAIARLIQLGVSLDTILRIGARFVDSPNV